MSGESYLEKMSAEPTSGGGGEGHTIRIRKDDDCDDNPRTSGGGGGGDTIKIRKDDDDNNCDDNPSAAAPAPKEELPKFIETLEDLEKIKLAYDEAGAAFSEDQEDKNEVKLEDDFVDEDAMKVEEEKFTPEDILKRTEAAKDLKDAGNQEFKQEKYRESILSYTRGLLCCPLCEKELRSILYANRGAAKIQLGYKDLAVMDCSKSLEYNPDYMKPLIRRAVMYEELDKLDEALEDYKKILKIDPTYRDAVVATQRLPPLINERNEKLKEEMLGKLKDLGNIVLSPFGLSTDNFKLDQQPGGGYSINFQK